MKKLLTTFFILSTIALYADEGMWLPILLDELNIEDMQSKGFKLTAEDIYSVNKSSMKDAVVLFGGGCTGEVISDQGLLLTNHHCGFSSVNALSTVDHNYLRDGYWAYDKSQELPCPGLSVTFIISMHDVTDSITPFLSPKMTEQERNEMIKAAATNLIAEFTAGTHYGGTVRPFYYGSEFYLFVTETFTDIRLVGAPPSSVGDFGGETDNWVWPRHSCDFSMFRIYADAENKPAQFSESNIPFKPRYYFPISLKGVGENDFTMVYGFPGATQEYLPSQAVDLLMNTTDPNRIACRDIRLDVMNKYMIGNDTIELKYASKAKSLANAYKKWKGEMLGLEVNHAVEKKLEFENKFRQWANTHEGKDYRTLLQEIDSTYAAYKPYSELVDFTVEGFYGVELMKFAANFESLVTLVQSDTATKEELQLKADETWKKAQGFYKNYYAPIDKEIFASLIELYAHKVDDKLKADYFKAEEAKYNGNFQQWADDMFSRSVLADSVKLKKMLTGFTEKKAKKLINDPAFKLNHEVTILYNDQVKTFVTPYNEKISLLMRRFMQAQREMQPTKEFYPDANSTLRVAYGNVKSYFARDAVEYTYQTTDEGLEEKYIPGDEEFDLPAPLLQLFKSNDFGRYANKDGDLPVAFIATNHTTGGNSGSPVINANGELIGTNFDRVWEGTMSDVMYDINRCRNISLDIRYTLFIVDKYAGAKNIIDELWIVQ